MVKSYSKVGLRSQTLWRRAQTSLWNWSTDGPIIQALDWGGKMVWPKNTPKLSEYRTQTCPLFRSPMNEPPKIKSPDCWLHQHWLSWPLEGIRLWALEVEQADWGRGVPGPRPHLLDSHWTAKSHCTAAMSLTMTILKTTKRWPTATRLHVVAVLRVTRIVSAVAMGRRTRL